MAATWDDVEKRMAEMKISGWSSMGDFTPDEHLAHLAEIEMIRQRRRQARQRATSGEPVDAPTKSVPDLPGSKVGPAGPT